MRNKHAQDGGTTQDVQCWQAAIGRNRWIEAHDRDLNETLQQRLASLGSAARGVCEAPRLRGLLRGQPRENLRPHRRSRHDGPGDFTRIPQSVVRLAAHADTKKTHATFRVALVVGAYRGPDHRPAPGAERPLFDVGADLSMPLQASYDDDAQRVEAEWIDELDSDRDTYLERVEPLRPFILLGGTLAAAHLARRSHRRATCRALSLGRSGGPWDRVASEKGSGGVPSLRPISTDSPT